MAHESRLMAFTLVSLEMTGTVFTDAVKEELSLLLPSEISFLQKN